jgi:hypothetical protein
MADDKFCGTKFERTFPDGARHTYKVVHTEFR